MERALENTSGTLWAVSAAPSTSVQWEQAATSAAGHPGRAVTAGQRDGSRAARRRGFLLLVLYR